MSRPVVLLHGYSDRGKSLQAWGDALARAAGATPVPIHLSQYVSLSNEITIKDIAEGMDRAVRHLLGERQEFDAIVHSTGMLVIREWLTSYAVRARRLKHLIGLAPATFGSPLASKGRGPLGGLFKGSKDLDSPDFLEAGDRVLAALELGSRYTWDLAEKDLVGETPAYGPDADTPYPFIFIGLDDYGFLKRKLTDVGRGSDGTVRHAAATLDCRKYRIDLRDDASREARPRVRVWPTTPFTTPLMFVPGRHHGSILHRPGPELVRMVVEALAVESVDAYRDWMRRHESMSAAAHAAGDGAGGWQQFVVRLVDERRDPIHDWYLEVGARDDAGAFRSLDFDVHVHKYANDTSLRCFHVELARVRDVMQGELTIRLLASSGTPLLRYVGLGGHPERSQEDEDAWDAEVRVPAQVDGVTFFHPYTTTLVEIMLNREPLPLGAGPADIFRWWEPE
jgi:hypothetical protein